MPSHHCETQGATLRAAGDFGMDANMDFDAACQALLGAEGPVLHMDLTGVKLLASTYIGIIAETLLDARQSGRKLTVRCRGPIAELLRQAGLHDMAEIVEEGKDG